jgi:Na+/melibiose symporter-like transporter
VSHASAVKGARPLARSVVLFYGSVGLPLAIIGYPIAIWLIPHYSRTLGISLAGVSTMLMVARITDVFTDPPIGELSDRMRTRFGRRKPWLFLGTPIMVIGIWMLFVPPQGVGILYLLAWLTVMMLGSTLISLPYGAWGAELSPDYHQRSRITASREIYVLAGLLLAAFVPFLVEYLGDTNTGSVLRALAWTIVAVLPISIALVLWRVPEPQAAGREKVPLSEGFRHMAGNGPFVRILAILLLVTFGEAFRNALSLFFMSDVVGITNRGTAYLYYFGTGLLAIPLWLGLGKRIGKHRAFAIAMFSVSLISVSMFFLEFGQYWPFMALFIAKGFCFGALQFLPLAMLADVVDVDSIRSGGRRAGSFFAISGMTAKMATAFGSGAAGNMLALAGFDPSRGPGANGPQELLALAVLYAIAPALFFCAALYLVWHYPLTAERHAELREQLASQQPARAGEPEALPR